LTYILPLESAAGVSLSESGLKTFLHCLPPNPFTYGLEHDVCTGWAQGFGHRGIKQALYGFGDISGSSTNINQKGTVISEKGPTLAHVMYSTIIIRNGVKLDIFIHDLWI
jgi:hypothetical protein